MLFTLKRLLVLAVIAFLAYCFWPRTPSLTGFDEQRMSEIQIAIWKEAAAKKHLSLIPPLFELYHQQYGITPVASMMMALDMARALSIFFNAPDASEQENALVPLRTFYVNFKNSTKSTFDPDALARMELGTWMLQADHSKRAQLTASISERFAVLYGLSAESCLPAAKRFAQARKDAEEGRWDEAKAASFEGWQALKKIAPASLK